MRRAFSKSRHNASRADTGSDAGGFSNIPATRVGHSQAIDDRWEATGRETNNKDIRKPSKQIERVEPNTQTAPDAESFLQALICGDHDSPSPL